nr:PGC-1 and ERR-induced regulator in muscle protein 1 [Loxodonta africana]
MENFQYSVQLSDQDWAEFSATADECGLLQADLASGDEPLSSDIDQGDSSGSSPPRPPPLLTGQQILGGRGRWGYEEEDVDTQQLVSRCKPILALGACQQTPGTSTLSGVQQPLSSGVGPHSASLLRPVISGGEMQRLLQGSAVRGPTPGPPGEPPRSPEPPQRSPSSPGAPLRSPSRKKRRATGTKGGGRPGVPAQPDSPPRPQARPPLIAAEPATGTRQGPDFVQASGAGAGTLTPAPRRELGVGLPIPALVNESGADQVRIIPRAELHPICTADSEPPRNEAPATSDSQLSPDGAQSTPDSKLAPDGVLSTADSETSPDGDPSTPNSQPPLHGAPSAPDSEPSSHGIPPTHNSQPLPHRALSTPDSEPPSDGSLPTPDSEPPLGGALSTPVSQPPSDGTLSAPTSNPRVGVDLPMVVPEVKPHVDPSTPVAVATPRSALLHPAPQDMCMPAHRVITAAPSWSSIPEALPGVGEPAPAARLDVSLAMSPQGPEPSADTAGHLSAEPPAGPTQVPKRKKVRFSMAAASPEEPGVGVASGPPSPTRMEAGAQVAPGAWGARVAPGAWDAVAVRPRPPQPRILKHLPPPAPSASGGPRSGRFSLTLPEAYEFLFCDTIEEEEEDAEEGAAGQAPEDMQWPDVCEFFFQDCRAQRRRPHGGCTPASCLPAKPAPAPPPEDPAHISVPEVYEHFFEEERKDRVLELAPPPEPSVATITKELGLAGRQPVRTDVQRTDVTQDRYIKDRRVRDRHAVDGHVQGKCASEQSSWSRYVPLFLGEPWSSLPVFSFSQSDMCLVFVAFATWAVRTSDLHTPDAWKTVLLANIGTISAIRYFRRQVSRGRPSPSRSPSPSPSRSPSPSHSHSHSHSHSS